MGVVVNDFTTKGASTSATNSKKMGYVRKVCTEKGMPFVHIGESTGARLPDAMGSKGMGQLLGNDPSQFRRMRETPWIAAALDTSFGSSAWMCCCSDFTVMKRGSIMSVSSPRLVSMAIGEKVDLEALGGWRLHAEQTGLIDHFVDTDAEALAAIRHFLSYMPSNNAELPPTAPVTQESGEGQERLLEILPEKRTKVYNMKKMVEVIFDRDSFLEIKARFGRSAIVGLARLGGRTVGVIANNPNVGAGALSADACRKIIDLTVMCDSFNIPIIRLVDTPGFVVGLDAERRGAPGHIMNFMNATCLTTVPQITVLCRKAYGRAYVAMGGGAHNDAMVAWPTAEVSFMDPVFATSIVKNKTQGDEGFGEALAEIAKDLEIWDMGPHLLRPRCDQAPGDARLADQDAVDPATALRQRRWTASDAHMADEHLMPSPGEARSIIAKARAEGRTALDESTGKALLSCFGVRTPRSAVACDAEAAARIAAGMTSPFVVKVVSPDILHKTDAGGVALRLADAGAVRDAVSAMAAKPGIAGRRIDGWLVEEMVPAGRETVVGAVRDPQFGPMLMVGLGGIFIEVLHDVAFRICPIGVDDARAMLDALKGRALLRGARGEAAVDEAALIDVMLRLGGSDGLLMQFGDEIAEMDLNPVVVSATGAVAVDARFLLTAEPVSPPANKAPGTAPLETFRPLFEPRTIAVLGASSKEVTLANTFIRRLREIGFRRRDLPDPSFRDRDRGLVGVFLHGGGSGDRGLRLRRDRRAANSRHAGRSSRALPHRPGDFRRVRRGRGRQGAGADAGGEGKDRGDPPARPELPRHLFSAGRPHLPRRGTPRAGNDRRRHPIGRSRHRHHQAWTVARAALQ